MTTNSSTPIQFESLFARASGHFLSESLPLDWNSNPNYPEDFLDKFIDEHKWEPLERLDTDEVFNLIDILARDMAALIGSPSE